MKKLTNFAALGLALIGGQSQTVLCADTRVTIQVVDKKKAAVPGTVFLNPGKLQLGKTKDNGEYSFNHECKTGETFKAEPEDRAKYYDSEAKTCGPKVVLEVFPRPQISEVWFNAEPFIREVNSPTTPAMGKVYAGVFGVVAEKVEPVTGGEEKCRLTIEKKFKVGFYSTKMDHWKAVSKTLPQEGAQRDVVYYFRGSCANSWKQIGEIKKQANLELKSGVEDYFAVNSETITDAVVEATMLPW